MCLWTIAFYQYSNLVFFNFMIFVVFMLSSLKLPMRQSVIGLDKATFLTRVKQQGHHVQYLLYIHSQPDLLTRI